MFKRSITPLEGFGEVREQKKLLPYSIQPITSPLELKLWQVKADEKSAQREVERKLNAENAFRNGMGDWRQIRDVGSLTPKKETSWFGPINVMTFDIDYSKPSIITRIYNWFLNINYN